MDPIVGGCGAGSNLAWNIVSGLRRDMPWKIFSAGLVTFAGDRAYYPRASKESEGATTPLAAQPGSPAIGLGVEF